MKASRCVRHLVSVTLAVLVSLGVAAAARGATEVENQSLAGLPGVVVVVEAISPDAERDGLTQAALKTDVELRLRQAGIRVLTRTQSSRTPGSPYLYLNVTTYTRGDGLYAYSVSLGLNEIVRLERAPSSVGFAETWHALGHSGTVGMQGLHRVREVVRDMVDQFINAYLAANPKRQ